MTPSRITKPNTDLRGGSKAVCTFSFFTVKKHASINCRACGPLMRSKAMAAGPCAVARATMVSLEGEDTFLNLPEDTERSGPALKKIEVFEARLPRKFWRALCGLGFFSQLAV